MNITLTAVYGGELRYWTYSLQSPLCGCIMEAGSDSRDEHNYLMNIWNSSGHGNY